MNSKFLDDLIKAVVKWGKDQYFQYALEIGLIPPEIRASTACMPATACKLRALIEKKKGDVGDAKLVADLIKACSELDQPILEHVKREIELKGHTGVFLDYCNSTGVAPSSMPTDITNEEIMPTEMQSSSPRLEYMDSSVVLIVFDHLIML
jgi:hypothetical protein